MNLLEQLGINPEDSCVICGQIFSLSQLEKYSWKELCNWFHTKLFPGCLFRYFKYNKNSINALKKGTVYLNDTNKFDDCFDCAVDLDWHKFYEQRLRQYCKYFNIIDDLSIKGMLSKIAEKFICYGNSKMLIENIDNTLGEIQKLTIEKFVLLVFQIYSCSNNWESAIYEGIYDEYNHFVNSFKHFKIACFTVSPFLNRMWATNDSKGFCVEYEIDYNSEFFVNLFPVIYSQRRNDFLQLSQNFDKKPNEEDLKQMYFNGLLRKSVHWADQQEWRLIQYESDNKAKSVKFFKIKKVYLGNKMQVKERRKIIKICKEKQIPYVGIIRKQDSFDFMECAFDCANCKKY